MRLITPKAKDRQLFVSIKLAEVCNIACTYCYFFEHRDQSYKDAPSYMSPDIVEESARFLARGVKDLDIKTVEVAFHGGEPLMIGKDRMRHVCDTFSELLKGDAQIKLAVQTNGLLLDDEWIDIFSKRNIGIGISLDGLQKDHDRYRIDKRDGGTYTRVIRALRLLQHAKRNGIIASYGVLSVILPGANGRETYRHFVDDLGIESMDFLLPQYNYLTQTKRHVEDVTSFYEGVLAEWLSDDDPQICVRTLETILRGFLSDDAVHWRLNYIVDSLEGLSIRSNGDVCADDAIAALGGQFRANHTNVFGSLDEFYGRPLWHLLRQSIISMDSECRNCQWIGVCAGGATENRFDGENFTKRSIYCDLYKTLFEALYGYVSKFSATNVLPSRLALAEESVRSLVVA